MLHEMLANIAPRDGGTYVDATFGAGGYSRAMLQSADCTIYAIDRDASVLPLARAVEQEFGGHPKKKFKFLRGRFSELADLLPNDCVVDGIVLDIGVSSMQLDQADRGFSFSKEANLDMRMDQSELQNAQDLINKATETELADVFYHYGGEIKSRKIAKALINARKITPLTKTKQLADIIHATIGKRSGKIDSATRVFQAVRMWVNNEPEELDKALEESAKMLRIGGKLVVVTFHSLEDTIVKNFIQQCSAGQHYFFRSIGKKVIKPSPDEVKTNPRSRSAKMRALIKAEVMT
jgi:16S rRNA (cytosine1402-N4)-methyltransferase